LEQTPDEYVDQLVSVFREVRRVLRDDGTLWLNLGDSYAGSGKGAYADGQVRLTEKSAKQITSVGTTQGTFTKTAVNGLKSKDLVGIPWRVAFALQADGWYLRQDIIWHKPNPMPESVTDRCTKSHEYIFLLTKSAKYYYDHTAIKEPVAESSIKRAEYGWDCDRPSTKNASMGGEGIHVEKMGTRFVNPEGRNKRSVWTVATKPFKDAHFATFPPQLIEPCILAGCPENGTVLDPFFGAGTTGLVAQRHNRRWIGCELNPEYAEIARRRIQAESNLFTLETATVES
jgi:DNA modification methylase